MSPRWLHWPVGSPGTLGTMVVSDAKVDANIPAVEQSIKPDPSTSTVNGASGLSFESWNFRDNSKNGSWTDDGLGLLLTTSIPANPSNHSGWVSLLPTSSGTFYVYEAGTSTEIFRLNWTGSTNFAVDATQRYGSSSVDFVGSVAPNNTRVDIYYS
jgi:hypothetical protein